MATTNRPRYGEFILKLVLGSGAVDPGYVRKKTFKKEWVVPAGAPMFIVPLVFQTGAVLGYSRPKPDPLAELLDLGRDDESMTFDDAFRGQLTTWLARSPRKAESLHDVWNLAQFPEVDLTDMKTTERLAKDELRLGLLMAQASAAAVYGVAFGLHERSRFEQLWHATFETLRDEADWNEARRAGLAIPAQQTLYRLADAQENALNETAGYVRLYRPELLEPLELSNDSYE